MRLDYSPIVCAALRQAVPSCSDRTFPMALRKLQPNAPAGQSELDCGSAYAIAEAVTKVAALFHVRSFHAARKGRRARAAAVRCGALRRGTALAHNGGLASRCARARLDRLCLVRVPGTPVACSTVHIQLAGDSADTDAAAAGVRRRLTRRRWPHAFSGTALHRVEFELILS
jgi:hypothetical protein